MTKTIYLPDLPDSRVAWDGWTIGLGDSPSEYDLCRAWEVAFSVAICDKATSLHFHPWRTDCYLSMIVEGSRFEMVPPTDLNRFANAVFSLLGGFGIANSIRKWLGLPIHVSGRVRFIYQNQPSDWIGTLWSCDEFIGVEWYRISSLPLSNSASLGSEPEDQLRPEPTPPAR